MHTNRSVFPLELVISALLVVSTCVPLYPLERPPDERGQTDSEEIQLLHVAQKLFSKKQYPAAVKYYKKFIKRYSRHPRAPSARVMIAECFYQKALSESAHSDPQSGNAFRKAQKAYREALRSIPGGDLLAESVAYRLGEIEFNLKNYDAALEILEEMQTDFPEGLMRGEARLLRAQCLLVRKRSGEAVQILKTMLQDQPFYEKEPRTALIYGVALFETANSSQALTYLDPLQTPLACLYAGRAHLHLNKPLLAVEKFKKVAELDSQGDMVELSRYFVAEAFLAAKDYLSAIQSYSFFLRRYPQSPYRPGSMYKIGLAQFESKRYLEARGSLQSVLQLAANNEFAELSLYMIAESFFREDRFKEAAYAYADMADSFTSSLAGNARLKLGWCHYKQGDYSSAETALRQLIIQFPDHHLIPAGTFLLGNVLTRQERYKEATRSYLQTLDLLKESRMREDLKTDLREASLALAQRANLLKEDYGALVSGYQYLMNHTKTSSNLWRAATLLYVAEGNFRQGLMDKAVNIYNEVLKNFPAARESFYAIDGLAWSLARKGNYAEAWRKRQELMDYRDQTDDALPQTILAQVRIPDENFIENDYERASIRYNQKEYLDALDLYESFENNHPGHRLAAQASLQAGWCYYRLEYYGQAIKTWERVEMTYGDSPQAAQAAWSTADTYFRAEQYDRAIATYRRILQSYPQDPAANHARLRIAQSYYNGKEVLNAISSFVDLYQHAPDSPEAAQVLDFLTYLLPDPGSKSQALDALTRIAEMRPRSPEAAQARFRIARHYFKTGEHRKAIDSLELLIADLSLGEDMVDAQFYLAESYYHLKKYPEAALAYERTTANYPDDSRYITGLFHLGASRFNSDDLAGAAESFKKIVQEHPATSYAKVSLFNMGLAHKKLGNWEEASLAFKRYMEKYPEAAESANVSVELTSLYEEHRQFALATEVIIKQRASLPSDDLLRLELTHRLAEDYAAMDEEDKSIKEFEALVASPHRTNSFRLSALTKLAETYETNEMWAKALKAYEEIIRSAPRQDWVEAARSRAEAVREKLKHDTKNQKSKMSSRPAQAPVGIVNGGQP